MNQKLEAKYIIFIRQLAERPYPGGKNTDSRQMMIGIIDHARELHAELMASGYGK